MSDINFRVPREMEQRIFCCRKYRPALPGPFLRFLCATLRACVLCCTVSPVASSDTSPTYPYVLTFVLVHVVQSDYGTAIATADDSYSEGLYIACRHFDNAGIKHRYEFGFGLRYTIQASSPVRFPAAREAVPRRLGVPGVFGTWWPPSRRRGPTMARWRAQMLPSFISGSHHPRPRRRRNSCKGELVPTTGIRLRARGCCQVGHLIFMWEAARGISA